MVTRYRRLGPVCLLESYNVKAGYLGGGEGVLWQEGTCEAYCETDL